MAGGTTFFKLDHRQLPLLGLAVLCLLVGLLGYSFVESATLKLLESEARIDAERWSRYISSQTEELPAIATGARPSQAMSEKLGFGLAGNSVIALRVYDNTGILKMQSGAGLDPFLVGKPIAMIDSRLAQALKTRTPGTELYWDGETNESRFIASTIVPIEADRHTAGWLVVNIDQTSRQTLFTTETAKASLAVGLLLVTGPIFGFWFHARRKAQMAQAMVRLSQRDPLTGLTLKTPFLDEVEKALGANSGGAKSALILCELTGAPAVAQANGQAAEDKLIRDAALNLRTIAAGRADIAVAGRGTFLAFVRDASDPMQVMGLAKEITLTLGGSADAGGIKAGCPTHSGIAVFPTDASTAGDLMRCAELAAHAAKEQGTPGYGFYNSETASDQKRRTAVAKAVAAAVEHDGFRLDFQPVYNVRTGELNGFEALIRFTDKDLGHVSPAEFIPIAEEVGLINEIGGWCLQEACRVAAQWPAHLMVAVNLSPWQFLSGTLINDVRKALEDHQFPAYRLEVEITEGTLLNDSELVLGQLRVLRDMGVAVALDDFGTGYSSLSYLWKFPFSKLKIDRSFIMALDESQSARGILRSIIKLGHGLGLTVTAEGIENVKQLNTLRDLGCDLAQGYLLDRPSRIADLAAIILRNFANGLTRRTRETAANKSAA
jgi:EAL domain-containing protein (putative c-di-GMP-specific phosphodiesterase class I)/GGDEF domain-containing protein